jgi:hypothetical protein
MNCAEAKRFIPLMRQGELSPAEQRALADHLRSCPSCAAEQAGYLNLNRRIAKLRAIVPELPEPERSVQAILARVRAERRPEHQGYVSALVDRLIRALEVPGLRYALALFVTVTVTGFVFQQLTILQSVSALEARLSRPSTPRVRMAYAVNPEAVERLARAEEIRTILERSGEGIQTDRLGSARVGTLADLLDAPESREVLRALLPRAGRQTIDSLVAEFSRNIRFVLTTSKGDAAQ